MSEVSHTKGLGKWRFELRPLDGSSPIEAADTEPNVWGERLELLTVVRALETLDQRSRVTLVGSCRYVEQGIHFGLDEWKENDWRWEYFGQMIPVRDCDLWRRLDRLMEFHAVDCRWRRFDSSHAAISGPHWEMVGSGECGERRVIGRDALVWIKYSLQKADSRIRRQAGLLASRVRASVVLARRLAVGLYGILC